VAETWQVITRRDDGADVIIGVYLDEADAARQVAALADEGVTAAIASADMGECGCGG
jgi:hypothetical protein